MFSLGLLILSMILNTDDNDKTLFNYCDESLTDYT